MFARHDSFGIQVSRNHKALISDADNSRPDTYFHRYACTRTIGQCGHGCGLPLLAGTIGTLYDDLGTLLSVEKAEEALSVSTKVA